MDVVTPNKSVERQDFARLAAQSRRLLAELQRGDVSVREMLSLGMPQYNARISEIRDALRADLLTVAIVRTEGRMNWYGIRPISQVGDPKRGARPPSRQTCLTRKSVSRAGYTLADETLRADAAKQRRKTPKQLFLFRYK